MKIAYARIIKHGTSLGVIMTKEIRELGLEYGDWVKVTIEPMPSPGRTSDTAAEETQPITKLTPREDMTTITPTPTKPKVYKAPECTNVHNRSNDYTAKNADFDPSAVGEKILATTSTTEFTDEELKKLIATYDGDQEHVENIFQYIRRSKNENERDDHKRLWNIPRSVLYRTAGLVQHNNPVIIRNRG